MNCRNCRAPVTLPFIDLGSAPPSNAYITLEEKNRPELWYPLRSAHLFRVLACADRGLREANEIFKEDYAYFSSCSQSWLEHAARCVSKAIC